MPSKNDNDYEKVNTLVDNYSSESYKKIYDDELEFEHDFVELLKHRGWGRCPVLRYPSEEELIDNWARILYDNNRDIDRLGNYPLVKEEMDQIIEQVREKKTPFALNSFINGKSISITRKNPDDKLHFGKEVSLRIYDRLEIAGGKSVYQIVEQPRFKASNEIFPQRRGDVMLLINGMPVFHIELKKSGVPLIKAQNQIEKYSNEGIFRGIFSLVQIFIAMTPEDAVYFANPGPGVKTFNRKFQFHWADSDNEPVKNWIEFTKKLLYIPMAHELIGFYTVPDKKDGVLKVLRPYQYYAVSAIMNKVMGNDWNSKNQRGGFVWHTTGSGKTLTSFKTADLISKSQKADKVVFLVDRIELDTQSYDRYVDFSDADVSVNRAESVEDLITRLKSPKDADETLIVASIQKMYRINEDGGTRRQNDLEKINSKRLVFIVDECHRDTFGDMMDKIKKTFPNALFFGFTGTPIKEENRKKGSMSSDVFGCELHRYTIRDGIRDGSVLGFDPYKVCTFKDMDLKKKVALELCKASDENEVLNDPTRREKYYDILNNMPMTGHEDDTGRHIKGIEDYIPNSQYNTPEHEDAVVGDILEKYQTISHGGKFHAIFATSSIPEAISYYKLFKERSNLNISLLVDPHEDNDDGNAYKVESLAEVIQDYNKMYDTHYTFSTYGDMKKDISLRMSHEKAYAGISKYPEKQLNILIVVNQMLTGFDSKWVNVLFADKVMEKENIIQAFSRTNRVFSPEKPFGIIYYYRKPHTMEMNVEEAIRIYSGNNPYMVFVSKLEENLKKFNGIYNEIKRVFFADGIYDFSHLPQSDEAKMKFAKDFNKLNDVLEMIKIQDFDWSRQEYSFVNEKITVELTEATYRKLLQRYKELAKEVGRSGGDDIPYELDSYITEISTGKIDVEFLNANYKKFMKLRMSSEDKEACDKALDELIASFAFLSTEDQEYAKILINDIQLGNLTPKEGNTFMEYITMYKKNARDTIVSKYADTFGIDANLLQEIMTLHPNGQNLNEFGNYDKLKKTLDTEKTKAYFEKKYGKPVTEFKAKSMFDTLTNKFIAEGGFDITKE